ncbi:MAG: serine protease [Proteobacteria bacterium]|nr:serine protease [Pseudomonadota bacterium]
MPRHISQQSFQSLFIEMKFEGTLLSTGTAFFAQLPNRPSFLITNRHNVTGRNQETKQPLSKTFAIPDSLTVSQNSKRELGHFSKVDLPLFSIDGQPIWIEHPELGAEADFVAIHIPDIPDANEHNTFPYVINPLAHLKITPSQRVAVIGFPFGIRSAVSFAIWVTGYIASEPEIDHEGRPIFLIDCRARAGQSGSPVILCNENTPLTANTSELLGIYSGRINNESDLGIVWNAYAIAELLEHATIKILLTNK